MDLIIPLQLKFLAILTGGPNCPISPGGPGKPCSPFIPISPGEPCSPVGPLGPTLPSLPGKHYYYIIIQQYCKTDIKN